MPEWKRRDGFILVYNELNDRWSRFSDNFGVQSIKVDILTGYHHMQIFVDSSISGRNTSWLPYDDLTKRSIMSKCYRIGLRVIDTDGAIEIVQQILMEDIERASVILEHDKLGFAQLDDQEIFLLDSPLGISGPKSASHYCFPALKPNGSLSAFTAGMERLVFRRPTLETALAIGAVAPVAHLLREEGIIDTLPIIALIGTSSSGKTTSLRASAALWARPTEGTGIIDNLFATENAFFAALERSKAFPSFIDETTAAQSVGIQWRFDQMIYLLAQGKGKNRCNASGKLRHTPEFSGCVVFTGEESLLARTSKHQGLYARILELSVDHWTDSDIHADAIRTFITRHYGAAAPVMMWWLLQNRRKIPRMFEEECNDLSNLFAINPGVESRLIKIAAQIMVGARVLNASLEWMLDLHAMRSFLASQLVGSRPQRDKSTTTYDRILQMICEHASKFIREEKRNNESRTFRGEEMGIPTNIKTLLSGNVVEWARIEFKETWDPEASLKTICAFANDIDNWGGGYIVIGVEDKQGQPDNRPGVPNEKIDGYLKDMLNKCKRIQPEYMPIAEVVEYQEKHFIVVWAPGGSNRPYSSPRTMAKDCKERIYWIRKMASTVMPTEEQKKDLYDLANNVPFDDRVNHQANLEDLNLTLIQQYLREVDSSLYEESGRRDFASLCRDMNLNSELPEYAKPKNVGLMFFSLEPHRFFPYAQIDVVQFPDDLGGDQIIEKTFKGPLHQQLREALQYIRNVVITERIEKLPDIAEAKRYFNYPYAAIEESLSNAVYHKGYDIREPIEVRILPDKIEIVSHPGADRSISIENLKNYRAASRRYRNRRIGEFLKELHLTEGRNTGFQKIIRALKTNGSPMPVFETDEERTYFVTTIFIHPDFLSSGEERNKERNKDTNDELTDNEQLVMNAMQMDGSITIAQMASLLGLPKSAIEKAIKGLKRKERIQREGATKNGKWVIIK